MTVKLLIRRGLTIFLFLTMIFSFIGIVKAQPQINVIIEMGTSPNANKKQITVKYNAVGGNFESSNGSDEWSPQTITMGWAPGTGMTSQQPNPDVTSFDAPSNFSFVDMFSGGTSTINSYTLNLLGGTDDGNVQVTQDGGKNWTNTISNISGNSWDLFINVLRVF